jgi:hypothetical protein
VLPLLAFATEQRMRVGADRVSALVAIRPACGAHRVRLSKQKRKENEVSKRTSGSIGLILLLIANIGSQTLADSPTTIVPNRPPIAHKATRALTALQPMQPVATVSHAEINAATPGSPGSAAVTTRGDATRPSSPRPAARARYYQRQIERSTPTFEPNQGQADPAIKFLARGPAFTASLDQNGFTLEAVGPHPKPPTPDRGGAPVKTASVGLSLPSAQLPGTPFETTQARVSFVGANPAVKIEGLDLTQAKVNYFVGQDSTKWQRNIPTYARVRYRNLYPGVDLVYYGGKNRQIEYDLVAAPGADPSQIRLHVTGDQKAVLDDNGNLRLDGPRGVISLQRPMLYQDISGGKKAIAGSFVELASNEFGFKASGYDRSKVLIIDPSIALVYSTLMGGVHDDEATAMTLDSGGNIYLTGFTASENFPVGGNAYQPTRQNIGVYVYNAFVSEFTGSGILLYSTFLGGSTGDYARSIAVDADGNAYVAGAANSSDFPVTSNALQSTLQGSDDAFVSEISPDGSQLIYSTYLGGPGADEAHAIALSSGGTVYVAGAADVGFPTTSGAFQAQAKGPDDAFVAMLGLTKKGSEQLVYSTVLGGSSTNGGPDGANALTIGSNGEIYVAGETHSEDFPVLPNALISTFTSSGGCYNGNVPWSSAFVTGFKADLSSLVLSTYLGGQTEGSTPGVQQGCAQRALSIHTDTKGDVWAVGTTSESDFPVTANAVQGTFAGGFDGFVAELNPDGSKLLYGTYLGGSQFDYGEHAAWDSAGNIYITGTTDSPDYPVTKGAYQPGPGGNYDALVSELSPDGSSLIYSTYFGGSGEENIDGLGSIEVDPQGNIYFAGNSDSSNFPTTADAFQPLLAAGDDGHGDAFLTILGSGAIGVVTPTVGGNTGDTTITVSGAGLQSGATCSLVAGDVSIAAVASSVNSNGTSITCTFALNGAATGSYDVVVNNPRGSSFTKQAAFTVQSGGQPQVWVDVVGRPKIRTGTRGIFYVTFGNSGTTDAYFTPISISFPSTFAFDFGGGLLSGDPSDPTDYSASAVYTESGTSYVPLILPVIPAGSTGTLALELTALADEQFAITADVSLPWYDSLDQANGEINAALQAPLSIQNACYQNPATPYLDDCLGTFVSGAAQQILSNPPTVSANGTTVPSTPAPITQAEAATDALRSLAGSLGQALQAPAGGPTNAFRLSDKGRLSRELDGTSTSLPTPQVEGAVFVVVTVVIVLGALIWWIATHPAPTPCSSYTWVSHGTAADGTDIWTYPCYPNDADPNNCAHYICEDARCTGGTYDGTFVTVTKGTTNDPSSCQPSKFKCLYPGSKSRPDDLGHWSPDSSSGPGSGSAPGKCGGDCSSSGGSIDPNYKGGPSGDGSASQYVNGTTPLHYVVGFENEPTATLPAADVVVTDQLDPTKVDLSTLSLSTIAFGSNIITLPSGTNDYNTTHSLSASLSVRIQGSLDPTTNLLKWTFTSIDPTTGLSPTDPTVGFLPPDTNGVEGQGSVVFTVMPKAGQTTGAKITNQAAVVFDNSAPINTPTWLNTLDVTPPVSSVRALPAVEATTSFTVSWSGTDKGSGIASYSIYVSDNGGAFTAWQTATIATSASYTGQIGHTYGFYSIATDKVGNVEPAKDKADVTTALTPSFALSTMPTSATVMPGQTAQFSVNVAPENGFNQTISFTCSGAPSEATCSASPATVTLDGKDNVTVNVSVSTTAATSTALPRNWGGRINWFPGLLLALAGLLALGLRRRLVLRYILAASLLLVLAAASCGGGTSVAPPNPGTPAGTYSLSITGASGNVTQTVKISLVVQ